jgi:hypothetical protein
VPAAATLPYAATTTQHPAPSTQHHHHQNASALQTVLYRTFPEQTFSGELKARQNRPVRRHPQAPAQAILSFLSRYLQ